MFAITSFSLKMPWQTLTKYACEWHFLMVQLMLLIQGSGAVRPGQWARALCINDTLDNGTIFPYLRKAISLGYGWFLNLFITDWKGVIIFNPNQNSMPEDPLIRPSREGWPHCCIYWLWTRVLYSRKTKTEERAEKNQNTRSLWSLGTHHHSVGSVCERLGCQTTCDCCSLGWRHCMTIILNTKSSQCTMQLLKQRTNEVLKRLKAIAFTDSVHRFVHKKSMLICQCLTKRSESGPRFSCQECNQLGSIKQGKSSALMVLIPRSHWTHQKLHLILDVVVWVRAIPNTSGRVVPLSSPCFGSSKSVPSRKMCSLLYVHIHSNHNIDCLLQWSIVIIILQYDHNCSLNCASAWILFLLALFLILIDAHGAVLWHVHTPTMLARPAELWLYQVQAGCARGGATDRPRQCQPTPHQVVLCGRNSTTDVHSGSTHQAAHGTTLRSFGTPLHLSRGAGWAHLANQQKRECG